MGIEPTSLAWKAKVLPLNYTRIIKTQRNNALQYLYKNSNNLSAFVSQTHLDSAVLDGGGGWIRTSVLRENGFTVRRL